LFPFIDTAPRAKPAVLVLTLIAVNTLVFLWMSSLPPRALNATLLHFALVPVRYTEPGLARRAGLDPTNWWPLLTNTFMHGGWLHLISNMWFLWIFGPAMEARLGRFWFAVMYVGGALAASFVHLVTHPLSTEPALGASGAIAAVIAAYAVTYPWARVITIVPIVIIPLFIPIPALLFALIWFGIQVFQGTAEIATPGFAGGVAWWAHIGGFMFGAMFAYFAQLVGFGPSIRTTVWADTRGKRVPDIRPRGWNRR
jgi:membrane associated rhomboid family serine protease